MKRGKKTRSVELMLVGIVLRLVDLFGTCPFDLVGEYLSVSGIGGAVNLYFGIPQARAQQRTAAMQKDLLDSDP